MVASSSSGSKPEPLLPDLDMDLIADEELRNCSGKRTGPEDESQPAPKVQKTEVFQLEEDESPSLRFASKDC